MASVEAEKAGVDWENGRITEKALASVRQLLGRREEMRPWNSLVSRDSIWHFASGIGDDNPLWWDADYARRSSWGGLIAPPSYLYSCQNGGQAADDKRLFGIDSILPGVLGLWASTRWIWNRPARVGDEVRLFWELHSISDPKPSSFAGTAVDQVDRNIFCDAKGDTIGEVYRNIKRFERSGSRTQTPYANRPTAVYGEADRQRFAEQYERETAMRRGAEPRFVEDVKPGDALGPMLKGPLTLTNMVGWLMGWGSGFCQTNRIAHLFLKSHPGSRVFNADSGIEDTIEAPHWDAGLARKGGYPAGYDFGAQRFSWMMHLLTDWGGDDAFLAEFEGRLLRPNLIGDVTWIDGQVSEVRPGSPHGEAICAIKATNQLGEVTAAATARIRLRSRRKG
jgi:acyl dehydratase